MKASMLTAILITLSLTAFAQTKDAGTLKPDSDKLDLKKLEDKYWAAKDTDFSVVQNRTYTKAGRWYATASYGVLVNDPNSNGRLYNIAAGYYFSERWGVELAYQSGQVYDNDATDKYKQQFSTWPDYNTFKSYTSANLVWVPFYAKMSFLDRKIVYFDMQFALGIGNRQYTQKVSPDNGNNPNVILQGDQTQNALGYNFDFTQQLFFSDHFAVRLDLKNSWASEKRIRSYLSGSGGAGTQTEADRGLPSNTVNDTSLLLGLTFFY